MHFKVEKTGCSIRKGMVQIRYALYLDPEDYRYDEHYVDVRIYSKEDYTGKLDENGMPVDQLHFEEWFLNLPTEKRHNPFHNHFVQVEPDITDEEILYIGEVALLKAKRMWDKDMVPVIKNQRVIYPKITDERLDECYIKLLDIKSKELGKIDVVDTWQL